MTTPAAAVPTTTTATDADINRLHLHLEEIKDWVGKRFSELVALVEKAGPVVKELGAVAAAIPGAAPVVAAVEKAAGVAAGVVECCVHGEVHRRANGDCAYPGCSYKGATAASTSPSA
jgi:hypothetical protein